jgi:hypothetical protein
MWMSQGNEVKWKIEELYSKEEVANKLGNIPPQYSYFTRVVYVGRVYRKISQSPDYKFLLFIPEFLEKK